MPPPFCLDGAAKIIILPLVLFLFLPFLVNFDKVTHFKRPLIQMSQEYNISKMTHGNTVKSGESKNGNHEKDHFKEEGSVETCFSPPLTDHPISSLAAVASLAPPSPPNSSCTRPHLPLSPSCKDPAFTGKLLPKKRKIVHMILFSFEVTPVPLLLLRWTHWRST